MQNFVFLKLNGDNWKVFYKDILYIEAVNKYVRIFTRHTEKPFFLLFSLCQVEKLLPKHRFCRVHRSCIVSLRHITRFNTELVYIAGKELPIGRHYRSTLENRVTIWGAREGRGLASHDIDSLLKNL